jgi:UPF0716 protein FxsA
MPALIVVVLLVLAPLTEIAVLIEVGGRIGLWPTLALVVLTAVVGVLMIRLQGFVVVKRLRAQLDRGEPPLREVFDAVCLVIAGVLLLTPGFVTDVIGALLLLPPVRAALFRRSQLHAAKQRADAEAAARRRQGPVIEDVPYEEVDDEPRPPDAGPDSDRDELPPPRGGWGKR